MKLRLSKQYKQAKFAMSCVGREGKWYKQDIECRWSSQSDAEHDFNRIISGMDPEKTVPMYETFDDLNP